MSQPSKGSWRLIAGVVLLTIMGVSGWGFYANLQSAEQLLPSIESEHEGWFDAPDAINGQACKYRYPPWFDGDGFMVIEMRCVFPTKSRPEVRPGDLLLDKEGSV